MSDATAVVLAAGKGTRMESDLPKVLAEVCGRPLIDYVLDALDAAGVARKVVVVGYEAQLVRKAIQDRPGVEFALQEQQLGTGHAVQMCRPALERHEGPVLVLAGDSPLIQASSLRELLDLFRELQPACLLGTLHKEDPTGLGRIVRENGRFVGIVEEKDATDAQRRITEVNMSTYVFRGPDLLEALNHLRNENRQGEFYITDCPGWLREQGRPVDARPVLKPCESLSVNTVAELKIVEEEMKRMRGEGIA